MEEEHEKEEKTSKETHSHSEKKWRIVDAIFSGGFFGLFYDSEKARKEKDDKKYKELLYGAILGIVGCGILFLIIYLNL
ncbi:hypothetical protein [Bacillus alkalicellulosilyticus]|uniref:hypothetical protein n=1 Tax=Alkalihalobacterium alkalicellulosilyticum TaxID=1912214 RepID=UPI0009969924|nr:hypothetical protein [Bacillus alkalicellulosilyticus]